MSALTPDPPAALVAQALNQRPDAQRPRFLRELLAHTAAGLVIIEGEPEAAEAVYRLADAVATRRGRGGPAYAPPAPPRFRERLRAALAALRGK